MGKIKLWFQRQKEKIRGWWLIFQIETLHTKYYGRQTARPSQLKAQKPDVAIKTPQKVTIRAKIIRADGQIEDLGIISRSD